MRDFEQQARRATTATSLLDVAAWVGMGASMIFWSIFFLTLVGPVTLVESLLSVALAGCYTVVLPMLISILAPGTPAGMLLAETRWKTFGHAIAVLATVYMVGHALFALWSWWASRPVVVAAGQDFFLALGSVVVLIIVPALSWVQMAPDRWVAEVIQARQVQRLRAAQQANLMLAQAQYARALALIRRGLANATAREVEEVSGTIVALQRAENEAVGQIADQLAIITGIDTGVSLLDDPAIEQQYHDLADALRRVTTKIRVALPETPAADSMPLIRRGAEGAEDHV